MIIYLLIHFRGLCQDLSLAGKQKGLGEDTRSGLLKEVGRILSELKELGDDHLPQILLMENVPPLIGKKFFKSFEEWCYFLSGLGYSNYYQILNAKDYGIPQNRERVFCISILGQYTYQFPTTIPLKHKLKDLLEKNENVPEEFFLTKKKIAAVEKWDAYEKPLDKMEQIDKDGISPTLTTRIGDDTSSMILIKGEPINDEPKLMKEELCENLIKDGKVQEYDVIRHSYTTSRTEEWEKRNVECNNLSPTLDTRCDCLGVVVPDEE